MNDKVIFHDKGLHLTDKMILLLLDENHRQINKWGYQKHDILKWMAIIGEEVGELNKAALGFEVNAKHEMGPALYHELLHNIKCESIQLATLALKMIRMCDDKLNPREVEDEIS